jgi:hypothetical protein
MVARSITICVIVCLLAVMNVSEAAGTASGAFTDGKLGTIAPTHAAAYLVRDQFDARTTTVEILLTDQPVDPKPIIGALDPHAAAINLESVMRHNYILVWVKPDGEVSMNATFGATMTQFIDRTDQTLEAEFTTRTAARIEGRVFTASPVKARDSTYTVELRFSVDVPQPVGTPLPKGGGEPGTAFNAFIAAASKKDWAGIRAGASPAAFKRFNDEFRSESENAAEALDTLKIWIPLSKMTVTTGQLRGEVAILDVEGEYSPGDVSLSQVQMVKAGNVWQFDRAVRVGFVK